MWGWETTGFIITVLGLLVVFEVVPPSAEFGGPQWAFSLAGIMFVLAGIILMAIGDVISKLEEKDDR